MIAELMKNLPEQLRNNANDAEIQFPKAAASARQLADGIESRRLRQLAENAINAMLIPQGPESFQMASRLKDEMWELIKETKGGNANLPNGEPNPYMQDELDQYLKMLMGMQPGNTFEQMCQGKRGFGKGKGGGRGIGLGATGNGATNGYSSGQPQIGLLGNEQLGGKNTNSNKPGKGKGKHGDGTSNGNTVMESDQDSGASTKNSRKTQAGSQFQSSFDQ